MLVSLASTAVVGTTGLCFAQGEHGRRAGAELQVLIGDVRQLVATDETTLVDSSNRAQQQPAPVDKDLVKTGLVDRIQGSLSAIDILLRLADQESGRPSKSYTTLVNDAFELTTTERWIQLEALLTGIEAQFPLVLPQFTETTVLLDSSHQIHRRLCAGCHDNPVSQVERPAYNLYEQSRSVSDIEFFARLLVGVRGDRVTGIDNPFTDAELAGLIFLYQSTAR